MLAKQVAVSHGKSTSRWFWSKAGRPFCLRARRRVGELIDTLPGCSFRRVAAFLFATLILTSATQVLSPAALPTYSETEKRVESDDPFRKSQPYAWLSNVQRHSYAPLSSRLEPPVGYERIAVARDSLAAWLRNLPVAPEGAEVTTSDSTVMIAADHPNLAAVIQLQPHSRKLLSATNMLIRLRAEYGWSHGVDDVAFHYTSGQRADWTDWAAGLRPTGAGFDLRFAKASVADSSRSNFCGYLKTLFRHASPASLLDDTRPVRDSTIAAGDILLSTNEDGHALMVLDIATDPLGRVRVMLGEGGSPAVTFHVIKNDAGTAWFPFARGRTIDLGRLGRFDVTHLRRWVR